MPDGLDTGVLKKVKTLQSEIKAHLSDNHKGERLRDGLKIAIIGAPNAGKSSLLNWLADRDAVIVSDIAGTTRDIVDVNLNLGGYPVIVSDTAGLRADHSDVIEAEGIRRAIMRAEDADLKIALFDASQPMDAATKTQIDDQTLVVLNKCDLENAACTRAEETLESLSISVREGQGMDVFQNHLLSLVKQYFEGAEHQPLLTRTRHRVHLQDCLSFLIAAGQTDLPELAAEDLRQALLSIGRLTGRVDVEDLLDVVFHDFCIGK